MSDEWSEAADAGLLTFLGSMHRRFPDIEVDSSRLSRRQYSYDASNYRVRPAAVAFPRSDAEVSAIMSAAVTNALSVVARGAGTSMAGNAIGPGVVLDLSRHMNRVLEVRPAERVAVVQVGARLLDLQREAARHGLMFAPDPVIR